MGVFSKMLLFFAVWCICLTACGSDSDSSSASTSESEELSDGDSAKVVNVDAKATDAPIIWGKIQNNRTGDSIATIQVGRYIWLTQNTNQKGWGTYSVCYGKDNSNCDIYGRHYQPQEAGTACPAGFNVPTKSDWKWLGKFSEKHPEVIDAMQIKYGGYCIDKIDSVQCKNKDDLGKYLALNGIAVLKPGSLNPSFEDTVKYGLYQLRCVTYTYIVATTDDLPECDSLAKATLGAFYVVSEKSNYRCLGDRWEDDFNDSCSHVVNRTAVTINDTLYICKYENWEVASISESREICSDKNDSTTLLFNGERYACEDSSWRRFTDIEDKLGYCHGKLIGSIDSLKKKVYDKEALDSIIKYNGYYCDTNGWRNAVMTDYVGYCDSSRIYEKVKFRDSTYVCRGEKWDGLTELEKEIDVCSPKKQGHIDSTEDKDVYICDKAKWRYAELADFIGKCDSSQLEKTAKHDKKTFYCSKSGWHEMSALEIELGMCTDKNDKALAKTKSGQDYICNSPKWNTAKIADVFGFCDSTRLYEKIVFSNYEYYCYNKYWNRMSAQDSAIGFCSKANLGKIDSTNINNVKKRYYCDSTGWTSLSILEMRIGRCTSENIGEKKKTSGDSVYVCSQKGWSIGTMTDHLGPCNASNRWTTGSYHNETYVCRKTSTWTTITDFEKKHGVCTEAICGSRLEDSGKYYNCSCNKLEWVTISDTIWNLGTCAKDTTYYIQTKATWYYECSKGSWYPVTDPYSVYGSCYYGDNEGRTVVIQDKSYACDPYDLLWMKWAPLTPYDDAKGYYCSSTKKKDTLFYDNAYYMCDTNKTTGPDEPRFAWKEVSIREYMRDCTPSAEGKVMFNGFNESKCTNGKWTGITTETMTDSRDGKKYRVLTVNGVSWMVENLAYSTDSSWCIGNMSNCSNGRLYAWTPAQKACPSGWRLPKKDDWNNMYSFLDSFGNEFSFYGPGWNKSEGEDLYGLNITPTGFFEFYMQNGADPMTTQSHTTSGAYFWKDGGNHMEFGDMFKPDSSAQYVNAKILGIGIRCVKD